MKRFAAISLIVLCLGFASYAGAKEDPNDPMLAAPDHQTAASAEAANTPSPADVANMNVGAPEKKKGLPQFDPSSYPSQIFWLAVTFAVMYAFFSRLTLPRIAKGQQRRRAHIGHDMEAAQKARENAEIARSRYELAVAKAREKSTELYKAAEGEVKARAAAGIEDFKARSARNIQQTESEIETAKKDAMDSVHTIAAEIAAVAAKKIIGVSADVDEAKTVVRNINRKAA